MTGIAMFLLMLTSYHEKPVYNEMEYNVIRQLALLSVEKLDHDTCTLDWNYYGDENYFAFGEDCRSKIGLKEISVKNVVVIDIKGMEFRRFNELQF